MACGAEGVLDVVSRLTVVPTAKVSDRAIAEDVVAAIQRNTNADIKQVNVEVRNGVVTLTGVVPSLAAFDSATDAAEFTRGVINVINDLVIQKGPVESNAVC